jgi:hypothetical protein
MCELPRPDQDMTFQNFADSTWAEHLENNGEKKSMDFRNDMRTCEWTKMKDVCEIDEALEICETGSNFYDTDNSVCFECPWNKEDCQSEACQNQCTACSERELYLIKKSFEENSQEDTLEGFCDDVAQAQDPYEAQTFYMPLEAALKYRNMDANKYTPKNCRKEPMNYVCDMYKAIPTGCRDALLSIKQKVEVMNKVRTAGENPVTVMKAMCTNESKLGDIVDLRQNIAQFVQGTDTKVNMEYIKDMRFCESEKVETICEMINELYARKM